MEEKIKIDILSSDAVQYYTYKRDNKTFLIKNININKLLSGTQEKQAVQHQIISKEIQRELSILNFIKDTKENFIAKFISSEKSKTGNIIIIYEIVQDDNFITLENLKRCSLQPHSNNMTDIHRLISQTYPFFKDEKINNPFKIILEKYDEDTFQETIDELQKLKDLTYTQNKYKDILILSILKLNELSKNFISGIDRNNINKITYDPVLYYFIQYFHSIINGIKDKEFYVEHITHPLKNIDQDINKIYLLEQKIERYKKPNEDILKIKLINDKQLFRRPIERTISQEEEEGEYVNIPYSIVIIMMKKLALMINELNNHGIVYNNFKLKNIRFVNKSLDIELFDFEYSHPKRYDKIIGSLYYLSPEKINLLINDVRADVVLIEKIEEIFLASDVWGFGMLFYNLLNTKSSFFDGIFDDLFKG